jgi:hypothetical protein
MGTDIELLVAGNCVAGKEDQDPALRIDYKGMFEPIDESTCPTSSAGAWIFALQP